MSSDSSKRLSSRIPPPKALVDDPNIIVVSNKRPIQVYSERVIKKFRLENATELRLVALGAAISTAQRVARFCVSKLKDETGWNISVETESDEYVVINEIPETEFGSGFGIEPAVPVERKINSVSIVLKKL